MLGKDLHYLTKAVPLIYPIVGNNDTEGTPLTSKLDCKNFESNEVIALLGISADTLSGSVKVDVVAKDSADGTTFAAVTDATYLIGATPDGNGIIATIDDAAEDPAMVRCGYKGPKRYFALFLDFTGTHTNGIPIAMVGIQSGAKYPPVSDS